MLPLEEDLWFPLSHPLFLRRVSHPFLRTTQENRKSISPQLYVQIPYFWWVYEEFFLGMPYQDIKVLKIENMEIKG